MYAPSTRFVHRRTSRLKNKPHLVVVRLRGIMSAKMNCVCILFSHRSIPKMLYKTAIDMMNLALQLILSHNLIPLEVRNYI